MSLLLSFDEYQKARAKFVQIVADASARPQNIDVMNNAGVLQLLKPLLADNVPSIQQTAALSLGRLANHNELIAQAVVNNNILPTLVISLSDQNRFSKRASAFVLRAIAKHSASLADDVVTANALPGLISCLSEFDSSVKEAAAWALGYIAQHSQELAQKVVDAGAIAPLATCVKDPEITLKRIATSSLGDIAKHSPELAQAVVESGVSESLAALVLNPDAKLKRQVCATLTNIGKHSTALAEVLIEAELFPNILSCLKDADQIVKKNACMCIREISKHSQELAKFVVNAGGAAVLVDYVHESFGNNKLPGVMALGYLAAFSEAHALAIIVANGVLPIKDALVLESEDHIKAASAWALGQIGRHSADHARAVAETDVLRHLLTCMIHIDSSEDLQTKAKRSLKSIISKCNHIQALQPLLSDSPMKVQKYVLKQFSQILPNDVEARKNFVQSGGLKHLQELNESSGGKLTEFIAPINSCYPPEVIEFYSPDYSKALLDKVSEYQPIAV